MNSGGKMRGRVRSKHVHRQEKVIPGLFIIVMVMMTVMRKLTIQGT